MPGPGNKQKTPKKKASAVPEPPALFPEVPALRLDDPDLEPWVRSLLERLDPIDLRLLARKAYNAGYEAGHDKGCKNSDTYKAGYGLGFEDGIMEANTRALDKKMERINTHASTQTDAPAIIRTREASSQANTVTRSAASQANPTCLNATSQTTPATCDATSQTSLTPHATTVGFPQPAIVPAREPGSVKTEETQTEPCSCEAASQTNEAPPPVPHRPRSAPPNGYTSRAGNVNCDTSLKSTAPADSEPPHTAPAACETPPVELSINSASSQTNTALPLPPFDPDPKSHTNWADDIELASKIADNIPRPPSKTARNLSALCPNPRETIWTPQRHRMRRPRPRTGRTRRGLTQPTPPALFEATNSALGPIFTRKHPTGIAYGKPVVITAFGAPTPLPPHPAPPSPVLPLPHLASPPSVPLPPRLAPPSPAPSPPPRPTPSHSSGLDWESDPRLVDLSNALRALGWIRPPDNTNPPRG